MSWKDEVEEIERRRARALEQGGTEAVAKQHGRGRLTARERVAGLIDKDSFREIGGIAGTSERDEQGNTVDFTPTNVVMGMASVGGRPVVIGSDDFTIRGGAYSQGSLRKGIYTDQLAVNMRVPLIRMLEGGGASVTGATGVSVSVNVAMQNLAFDGVNSSYQVVIPRDGVAGTPQEYVEMIFEHTLSIVATLTTTDILIAAWS